MATRKNRGSASKVSKGRKNRTQKGGFIGALKRVLGFSNDQDAKPSQNGNDSQSYDLLPEIKFGGKKSRGRSNK
jgi:hypothetical protein